MLRTRRIPAFLLAGLVILFLSLRAALAAEPAWLEIHSAHFTVITDAGEKRGREVALRFEQMRAVFANLLSKDRLHQSVPLTIFAFKDDKSFYELAPLSHGEPISGGGFFLSGDDQIFIGLNLLAPEPWHSVAHEFAHMLLNYNYPPAQGWFDEGLAEYFSSIRVDNKQVEIGGDPELRAFSIPNSVRTQRDTPPKSLTELLGTQVWMSIPDLFTVKHDTSSYTEGTHHTLFYAESWMVMHYLLNQKKLPESGTYFDLVLNQHVAVEEAIQKAYGMSPAQFEEKVKDYFHSQTGLAAALDAARRPGAQSGDSPQQPVHFPVPVDADQMAMNSKPLPEADARAMYASVLIRIPERREAGLKELQALATAAAPAPVVKKSEDSETEQSIPTKATGNEIAHRVLAWDHMQRGEFDEAIAELGDAASLNRNDMWIRFYLSVLKYRMAQAKHGEMQGLANMMQDLKAVLEWYPEFGAAYDLLAVARNEGGGPAAAMQAERAAMQLCPRDELYVFHLAQIYIAGKKWEAAQALLKRLKASNNPQIASQARERLAEIATERKYGVALASGASSPKLAPQKSPFDVLEQDAAQRAAQSAKPAQPAAADDKRPMKFIKGRLVKVDCSEAPAAVLTVSSEGTVLKLHASDYKSLLLIGADEFSCDWRNRPVTVNYKPEGTSSGDVVSLEVR